MSRWIVNVLFLFKLSQFLSLGQYIRVEYTYTSNTHAFRTCQAEGGYLILVHQLYQHVEDIRKQCPKKINDYYWIGNYSTVTPFMYLRGCFENATLGTKMFVLKGNSIAKCQARCENDYGIAITNEACQCVENHNSALEKLQQIDAGMCDIHRNEEILGGLSSAMAVYLHNKTDYTSDGINPYCWYGKCDGGRYYTFSPCSDMNSAKVVCGNYSSGNSTTSSWWEAMEECIQDHNSYLLAPEQFRNNVGSLCQGNDSTLTRTNQREYRDQIAIPDTGIEENFIFSNSLVCQTAKLTDLNMIETDVCNDRRHKAHGYICYLDGTQIPDLNSTSCIVTLKRQSIAQSPKATTIGLATGSGLVLIIVVFIFVVIMRRLRNKDKGNETPTSEKQNQRDRGSTVYADSKEGEYDVLHERKQRHLKKNEDVYAFVNSTSTKKAKNCYDSMSSLKDSKQDSNYDTCHKAKEDETYHTYDHTTRNVNGQIDRRTDNTYD